MKRSNFFGAVRSGGPFLLTACLAVLSILANILQIKASGNIWTWISIALAAAIILATFSSIRPLLRKTFRGAWLFQKVRESGLIDVEDRSNRLNRLPPAQIFNMPGIRCILITGILDVLFQNFREDVRNFISRGGQVYVLIIHPQEVSRSLPSSWVQADDDWMAYWTTNTNEAQAAVDGILEARLDEMPGFHLRFLHQLPPYFGILASNSISPENFDSHSFVRVQPLTFSQYVGRGVVFTLRKLPVSGESPFQYFADDLLRQWKIASSEDDYLRARGKIVRPRA